MARRLSREQGRVNPGVGFSEWRLGRLWSGILALLLSGVSASAWAAAPRELTLQDFHHTAWTQKDGAPAGIWSMAQTRDGWLWLGTASGLYRFDGVRFERHDLLPVDSIASRTVSDLFAARNGDLWVSYSFGGASVREASGAIRHFMPGGFPPGVPLDGFEEDASGRMWASLPQGLFTLENGQWMAPGPEWGLPQGAWSSYMRDATGAMWLFGEQGTYVLRAGASRFERMPVVLEEGVDLLQGLGGVFWVFDSRGFRPWRGEGLPEPVGPGDAGSVYRAKSKALIFARDGSVWKVACPAGICRVGKPGDGLPVRWRDVPSVDYFVGRDGLSSDSAMTLFEDREGNIWVGTQLGLDRFRPNDVAAVRFPSSSIYFALLSDREGNMWTGTAMRTTQLDRWWRLGAQPAESPEFNFEVTAVYLDDDGRFLLGGSEGLWRFNEGRFESLPRPEKEQGQRIQSIVRDADGKLWVSFRASTVYRLDGDTWTPKGGLSALPDLPPARAVRDSKGRVWFGYNANTLVLMEGARVRTYSEAHGLRTGTVTAVLPGEPTLVAGALGLSVFEAERFRSLQVTKPEVLLGITGLVKAKDGSLWLNGHAGGVRLAAEDVRRALEDPAYVMPFELFDMNDGMPGGAQQVRPLPTLVEGGDGRLWFASTNGLGWIDPANVRRNPTPPPVAIRTVSVDDRTYSPGQVLRLPPRTKELRIAYCALGLGMPERVVFRYRLEGVDDGWKDAGLRREANYTNLGPGKYRFQVMAANEDGVWNTDGATLELEIEPTFFQTGAFIVLCVVAAGLLLWLLYVLRLWQVTQRLRLRLEERHAERERIARELHDTLLQGIQALVLNVHGVTSRLPAGDERHGLQRALDRADDILTEGRDRVSALRDTSGGKDDLVAAFSLLLRELEANEKPRLHMSVSGDARTLEPLVADELYRLGREAIGNALAHSGANEVELRLSFERSALKLSVRDDGSGIDPGTLERGGRAGHWGLRGMKERATRLGGQLEIVSREGQGTEVVVAVQAAQAYLRQSLVGWRGLLRHLPGRR